MDMNSLEVHDYCDSKPKQMFLPCCTNVYSSLPAKRIMWKGECGEGRGGKMVWAGENSSCNKKLKCMFKQRMHKS